MLGFVLGAIFMFALPRREPPTAPAPQKKMPAPIPLPKPTVERAIFFEDVFIEWSRIAVWQDDVTEVAFWNAEQRAFSDCYEVRRIGDKFYFRSIPHLTKPVMTEGVSPDSPLQFTVPVGAETPPPTFRFRPVGGPILVRERTLPVPAPTPAVVPPLEKPVIEIPPKN